MQAHTDMLAYSIGFSSFNRYNGFILVTDFTPITEIKRGGGWPSCIISDQIQ